MYKREKKTKRKEERKNERKREIQPWWLSGLNSCECSIMHSSEDPGLNPARDTYSNTIRGGFIQHILFGLLFGNTRKGEERFPYQG